MSTEELTYGQESRAVLFGIFAFSTLVGLAAGYWFVPEGMSVVKTTLGGGALGFHAAMYPYTNRLLMMG